MSENESTLILIRTDMHIPYVYRLINEASKNEVVNILIDKRWGKTALKKIKESNLLSHDNIKSISYMKSSSRLDRFSLHLKEFYTFLYYLNRFKFKNFYTRRWFGYMRRLFKPLAVICKKSSKIRNKLAVPLINYFGPILFYKKSIKALLVDMGVTRVICTSVNLRFSMEEFYLATANKLNIPTYYHVLTWDNLSTKGTFLNKPKKMFSWSLSQKKQLLEYHGFADDAVSVVGPLYFEKWIDICHQLNTTKETEDKEPYILYLGSSANIIGDESYILQFLSYIVEKLNNDGGKEKELKFKADKIKILYKSHPAKPIVMNEYYNLQRKDQFGLCEDKDNELEYAKLLRNAVCVFGVNTSAMIDASFVSDNVYAITNVDKSRQLNVLHFEEMCKLFGIKKIKYQYPDKIESAVISSLHDETDSNLDVTKNDILLPASNLIWSEICQQNIS